VPLTVLRLDGSGWQQREDLWEALLAALGAPDWHGHSLDALFDSLVARLNRVPPPLRVEMAGVARTPPALVAYATRIRAVFEDAARETGEEIALCFVPALSSAARSCPPSRPNRDRKPAGATTSPKRSPPPR
jgi:RNAse (barnase) inhibitor barstar